MDKLAYGERDLALMAVAKTWSLELSTLTLPQNPLILVLEDVEKPGNLGAILRTADASGVSAIIVSGAGADPFNPNTIRASQGAVFTIPIAQASSATAIDCSRSEMLLSSPLELTERLTIRRPTFRSLPRLHSEAKHLA